MLELIFSIVLIVIGLVLPFLLFLVGKHFSSYKEEVLIWTLFYLVSAVIGLYLISKGVLLNYWLIQNGQLIGYIIFLLSILQITLLIIYIIYLFSRWAISFIKNPNPWSKIGLQANVTLQIMFLILFLIMPSMMFSLLYNIWAITSDQEYIMDTFDAFFYTFSINFSLPLTGVFVTFQHQVNSTGLLRTIQISQIITSKIIEFGVIGYIAANLGYLISSEKNSIQNRKRIRNQK
ncbi:hypothetical protein C161_18069 [Paenibacillus sp. FSL R5-192]|uniref:hypothetical protein n=1 Tax=unclassified Paenibacillus TaxID=185978 RepID=UPI0003E2496E|nr:hypothetical protein [Paenibacillus sp. FSL R5-192]ETT35138.1 hypothetical protein C161_18069 [Paenibacillus sp. FSL R5-192]